MPLNTIRGGQRYVYMYNWVPKVMNVCVPELEVEGVLIDILQFGPQHTCGSGSTVAVKHRTANDTEANTQK